MVAKNQLRNVMAERNALARISCRFIVHFYFSFQSATELYLVMEFVPGGDLRALLARHLI